jgi:hypothetical protein
MPTFDRPAREPAKGPSPRLRTRYYAFLSYSHKDKGLAEWLHRELEKFRVPGALAGKLTANGVVPRRLTPIFRDQHDLSAGDDLAVEIEAALAASQFLVVLCSPTAAISRWTNLEIESFKRTRPEGCVLAAVAAGEPFASDQPGHEREECFPPALRYKYDRRGHQTSKRAEPLAADFREGGEGRRIAFLKLVAGMLGVGLDELVQREQTRRQRRLAILAAASLGGMAVTSTLAVTAIQARDAAREQRREAEGLIGFMLGDLKDKLEPIGRLDALDGVGSRVLAYYQKEGTSDLPDAALLQRARALSLMGEVSNARGHLDEAQRLYTEAMAGTAEAVRRKPNDAQRIFEHAQNVYWIGDLARQRGELLQAETRLRQYKSLADRMAALEPNNLKYRMEVEYAETDLGVVLYYERNFNEAQRQFAAGLQTIQAVAGLVPNNGEYFKSVADSLAWLSDAEFAEGRLGDATGHRARQVALLQQLAKSTGDVRDREALIPAQESLGRLLGVSGNFPASLEQLGAAVGVAEAVVPSEPTNTGWMRDGATAKLAFAEFLLASGKQADASAQANSACSLVNRLVATDRSAVSFQIALRKCFLMQAQIAASAHNYAAAGAFANRALTIARSIHSPDAGDDRFWTVRAQRLVGDIEQGAGNPAAAQDSWRNAELLLPSSGAERPRDMVQRMILLQRLHHDAEAQQVADELKTMGYHRFEL